MSSAKAMVLEVRAVTGCGLSEAFHAVQAHPDDVNAAIVVVVKRGHMVSRWRSMRAAQAAWRSGYTACLADIESGELPLDDMAEAWRLAEAECSDIDAEPYVVEALEAP